MQGQALFSWVKRTINQTQRKFNKEKNKNGPRILQEGCFNPNFPVATPLCGPLFYQRQVTCVTNRMFQKCYSVTGEATSQKILAISACSWKLQILKFGLVSEAMFWIIFLIMACTISETEKPI